MRKKIFAVMNSVAVVLLLSGGAAFAQHGHMGGGHGMGHPGGMGATHEHHTAHRKTVAQQLSSKPKLSAKLSSLLPAGTDLQTAASGFRNLGQFVAAVHVSHNLGIPFSTLKAKMIGPPSESLGKAIHQLKPSANSRTAVREAQKQTKGDLRTEEGGSSSTSS
jgi:hypothetical protein